MDPGADRAVPGLISDHWLYAAFHLIALRGLRRGEAAGLRWCDIDLDHKIAYISWQIQYTGRALVLCPLKTASSSRVLALDATTVGYCAGTGRSKSAGTGRTAGSRAATCSPRWTVARCPRTT